MKINILFVIPQLNIGGAELQLLNLVKGIDKNIFNIYLCNLSKESNQLENKFKEAGVTILDIYKKTKYDITIIQKIRKAIRVNKINIVHSFLNNYWPRLAAIGFKRPVIISSERSIDNWWKKWYHFVADNILGLMTDRMVCNSYEIKKYYEKKVPTIKHKIDVIYNGIDPQRYSMIQNIKSITEFKEKYSISDKDICFGICASLRPVKDHRTLLQAINELSKTNKNFKVLIVGDGYLRSELERYVEENKLENYVVFTGQVENIQEVMSVIDIGILSSIQEGLSNAIIEYLLNRKPVIATAVGGNVELVKSGENGFLFKSGDYNELKEKMRYFLENRNKILEYGESAYNFAYDKFEYHRMINAYTDLYIKLIAKD